jgi:mannose-6-phosphate isomerase-like protein (cupin superfamily)
MKMTNRFSIEGHALTFLLVMFIGPAVVADDVNHEHETASPTIPSEPTSRGTRNLVVGPVTIKMLLEASNLGRDDIEVGELSLPGNFDPGENAGHAHTSLEIFYVVEGILGHEVNGKLFTLNPGDLGFVKPGDSIRHSVLSDVPMKALVIWVPGGEADRLIEHAGFKVEPLP